MGLKKSGLRGSLRNVSVGIDAIPDFLVSRPDDNSTQSGETKAFGVEITTTETWEKIDAKISSNVDGATRALINRVDDRANEDFERIATKDISDLSAGDAFRFDDLSEDITDDETYQFLLDADNNDYVRGWYDEDDQFPYNSDEDAITIERGIGSDGTFTSQNASYNILEIGNIL